MFEEVARYWLENRSNMPQDKTIFDELVDDLARVLADVYERGCSYGYEKGLEENLEEFQW